MTSPKNSGNKLRADTELANSLRQLSITSTGPSSAASLTPSTRSPRNFSSSYSSLSSLSPATTATRPSTARSSSRSSMRESTGAPALMRKSSTCSLRSVSGATSVSNLTVGGKPGSRTSPTRRLSAQMPSPLRRSSSSPERPVVTGVTVANEYFTTELEELHGDVNARQTETVVILNDACYGHRFSRPRTTRAGLSTIVERPERIKAGVLGVAMAYVRLGERHAEGRHPIHPGASPSSVPTMPFRIRKTSRKLPLMSPTVTNVHGIKWMEELKFMCESAEAKLAMGEKELERPNMDRGPGGEEPQKFHDGDLYLSAESLDALEGSLGAVCEAVDTVFTTTSRRAFVAVRPPGHHCSASYPSGFCWVNNVHVGIMHGALHHSLTHAAIIDFDLHHGDGSQSIAWAHNSKANKLQRNAAAWRKTSIGYFSIHDINSYPCEDGDDEKIRNASLCIQNAHGQSVWNVHLESWKSEDEFWALYETKYSVLLEKTRGYLRAQAQKLRATNQLPKAAIFLSAGFDASEWESAGMQRHNVNVPTGFYARITQDVIQIAAEEGLGVDGRIISVLEGGYSDRALVSGICSHLCGLVADQSPPVSLTDAAPNASTNGLAVGMSQRMGIIPSISKDPSLASVHAYDPSWWSSTELDKLDTPPPPPPPRHVAAPTYCSPTHASTAKAVDPARLRRSLSGMQPPPSSRPHSPLAPVPWFVAAQVLAKLLIPTDRDVDSCRPEDLNAEASRARRERQSEIMEAAGVPVPPEPTPAPPAQPTRASTRERKTVKPFGSEEPAPKPRGKAGSTLTVEKATARGIPTDTGAQRRASRRTSTASVASVSSYSIARPDSVASMRPESSISVRPPANLTVKKTRATTTTKTSKSSKKSAEATTSPDFLECAASTTSSTSNADSATASAASSTTTAPAKDSVESLASDVKKIKITFPTKAQREARDKEAREKAEQEQTSESSKTLIIPGSVPSSEPPTPDLPHFPMRIPSTSASSVVDGPFTPTIAPSTASFDSAFSVPEMATPSQPMPDFSRPPLNSSPFGGDFSGFSPAGRTRINSISSVASSVAQPSWLPPSSRVSITMSPNGSASPPSPGRLSDLPAFTSTSHIPFAPRRGGSGDSSVRSSPGSSVGGGLVRAQAARIAAMEAAAAGQAAWGAAPRPTPRSN